MFTVALLTTLMVAGGAQAVTPPTVLLGTAGQFAILAGSGMTNSGVTTISGDVGSSPTSTETGFAACPLAANCVNLTGTNHTARDPERALSASANGAPLSVARSWIVGGVLGSAVSHGCVRLANGTMRWLVLRIGPGVPVTITN